MFFAAVLALPLSACGDDDSPGSGENGESGETGEVGENDERRHGLTATEAAQVLAKVGDTEITAGEFAERLSNQSPYLRARYNSPERRREFLDSLVRFELMAQAAEREGLMDSPQVSRTRSQLLIQQLSREVFEEIQLSDISDEDAQTYYDSHLDEFRRPAQVRASHIFMRDRDAAQAVLRQALEDPSDMTRFRELAEEHNENEETRAGTRRGDLRFFTEEGVRSQPDAPDPIDPIDATVARAAFSLTQVGAVHPTLVEATGGFHIIKLTARRAPLERTFDEAKRAIRTRLWHERRTARMEAFVAELRERAEIEENEAALDSIRINFADDVPSPAAQGPQNGGQGQSPSGSQNGAGQ